MSRTELTYEELETRLAEAEAVIQALRSEQVDAIIGEKHLAVVRLKEAEEALAESTEAHRRLMELSFDGIAIYREGKIVFANSALAALLGAEDPEQLLGTDVKELAPAEYPEVLKDRLRQVREQGEAPLYELRLVRLDGTAVDAEVAGVLTTYEGQPSAQVVVRDITARKWAEEALRDSEERYRRVVEDMPALVCRFLPDGTLTFVNEHYCRYFHKGREELEGLNFFEFIPEEECEAVRGRFGSLTPENPTITYEHQVLAPDGTLRWQRWTDRALFDEEDCPVEYQSIGEDITERKQAREALEESEERFRTIVESAPSLLTISDPEGNNVYVSPNCEEIVGYTQQELQEGLKWWVHEDDTPSAREMFDRTFREGVGARDFEYKAHKKSGEVWHASSSWEVLRDREGHFVGVVLQTIDITERKRAEEELRRYAQESAERVKQLNCLYGISALVEKPDITLEEILRGVVRLIPSAWRYPEIACARLTIYGQEYRTDNYRETEWDQTADIVIRGEQVGTLQVCYLEERPESDEGPFAEEEWLLIRAIAERLGRIITRLRVEEALRESERALTIRNQIARVFLTTTDEEMYGEVLQVVLEASESKYGVFGYIDGEGNLVCPSMTRDIWDECQIPDKDIVFPPEKWGGIWGRALTEAKSFYSNGPLHVPEGHVPVVRVVAVPIIHRGEVIGLLEVGNKETDYGEQDQELLDATAGYIAPVLQAMLDRDREERERRRAEQALRESEQRYRDLVENVDDVLYAIDASGDLTYASPAIETILGYAPPEVVGRSFTEFFSPEDLPVVTQNFRRLLAGDSVGVNEYRVVSKSGEIRWMRVSSRPVFANHHVVGVRGVLSDVTERKQTERALHESERRYRQLVRALREGIWAIDEDRHTTFVNPRMAEMLGYTEDEMMGEDLFSFMEEESVKIAKRLLQRRAIGIKEQHDFEFLCKDGTTLYASLETTPITSAEGHYIGAIAAVADITKRRKAEEELRAAKDAAERARHEEEERRREAERRRQIAESLADVMTVLNSNRSLDEVLDYIAMQTAELLGNQAVGIYRLEEDGKLAIRAARGLLVAYATGREIPVGQAALERAMASREPVPIPNLARRLTGDGTAVHEAQRTTLAKTWADIYQALLAVPIIMGEELYGGVALYYSEPRDFPQEEIELATVFGDQVALAIENARLRDQVGEAAAVAERERLARDLHDAVTQTLFSATLIAEALPRVWERSPDRARDGLQELRSLTKGALAEMRTLLLELRPAALTEKPLGDLLGQLAEAMAGRSRVPIKLTVEGDSFLPEELQVAMYRIAQEALNNVAKHADASEASVSLLCEPGRVALHIRDDGCGFDPEDMLPEQLGIAIMRERSDSIGARMKVTSQVGSGTEVAVVWREAGGRKSHD